MHKLILILTLIFPILATANKSLGYINIGPMVHWNFKPSNSKLSFGIEASAWFLGNTYDEIGVPSGKELGYGLDFGFDIGRDVYRIYFEPQIEWKLSGFSIGPAFEFDSDLDLSGIGMQASVYSIWMPFIDFRYRTIAGTSSFTPGLYLKYPIPTNQWGDSNGIEGPF